MIDHTMCDMQVVRFCHWDFGPDLVMPTLLPLSRTALLMSYFTVFITASGLGPQN